jgi:hypothetical protein
MFYRPIVIAIAGLVLALSSSGLVAAQPTEEFSFVVVPEVASGPVGRGHVVTAIPTVDYKEYSGVFFVFEVVAGPNAGTSSAQGGCSPSNCASNFESPVSWTYNGRRPGTDVILVCATGIRSESTYELEVDGDHELCETAVMTWFDGGFPLGGNISAQAAENRARVAAAAQPAVTVPSTGTGIVTPPNTGDAGLAASTEPGRASYAIAGMGIFVLAGLATLRFTRAKS